MRDRITIEKRNIDAPVKDEAHFNEIFSDPINVWAAVITKKGDAIFDGVNIIGEMTHEIYIRFRPNITEESWITFKGKRYNILNVENLEERDEFLLLRCTNRGVGEAAKS